jgi:hypothetical protein
MSEEDLQRYWHDIRSRDTSPQRTYKAIHELGKHDFLVARSDIEQFLLSRDPELRYIALEVLARHWGLAEHWETAQAFLMHDPDSSCRIMGASALAVLKRNTQDRPTLELLATVVRDPEESPVVRQAAYAAMREIIEYDPGEQFRLAARDINLASDVDWTMVDTY